MIRLFKFLLFFSLTILSLRLESTELLAIDFDLGQVNQAECEQQFDFGLQESEIIRVSQNPKFWRAFVEPDKPLSDEKPYVTYYVFPQIGSNNTLSEVRADPQEIFLGINQKEALLASRDQFGHTTCSPRHIHDNIANRWCHGYIANNFAKFLEEKGVSKGVAAIAGGIFWAPKEYLVDLNPSANDFVFTYEDDISNRVSYQVSVFGDTFFERRPFQNFNFGSGSLPFVTLKVCLGDEAACARKRNRN